MEKVRILLVAANPLYSSRLALDEEIRDIYVKIRATTYRDNIEIITALAARPDDLLQLLNEHQPHIVHFSGHGTKSGEIVLSGERGEERVVSPIALQALFSTLKDNVRVVILNACYTESPAASISAVIDCTIGMQVTVEDEAARFFSAAFYRAIGFGRSVQQAFDQAVVALLLNGFDVKNKPVLVAKDNIDPREITLIQPPIDPTTTGSAYAFLLPIKDNRLEGEAIPLQYDELTLGRRGTDIMVHSNYSRVSNVHASIKHRAGRVYLQDRGSLHGTFVNGARVQELRLLHPGQRITLGGEQATDKVAAFEFSVGPYPAATQATEI